METITYILIFFFFFVVGYHFTDWIMGKKDKDRRVKEKEAAIKKAAPVKEKAKK